MGYYYRGTPRFVYNQDIYNLTGALILFGGLIFLVSALVLEWEMMVFGSGLMMLASFSSLCCLENSYKASLYEGVTPHQLERGEVDSDAE